MYEYLTGTITYLTAEYASLDVNGVGYKIAIPLHLFTRGLTLGGSVTLYTSQVIREDAHRLFGFATRSERDLFEKLISISGVGPKTALSLIGHMPEEELREAITSKNLTLLCRIPGIGKKTAERLSLELSGSLAKGGEEPLSSPHQDALSALLNLGYNMASAKKALEKVLSESPAKGANLSDLLASALRSGI